jgi:hypothetical protein
MRFEIFGLTRVIAVTLLYLQNGSEGIIGGLAL